jgi:HK97 family phage major capsid protein/HK97 family phage prohead protease
MNRAYSLLTVKAVSEDQRVISGIATTPTPDRVGDIVEPMGVTFKNPLPLLHQHNMREPVGTVKFGKPTKDGIPFEARLPMVSEPGPLKDRVDTAWGEIKLGLVRGVSIGFRALEYSIMDDGGYRFTKSEVYELSVVTVAANVEATITTIKAIDSRQLAASGRKLKGSTSPGVSGSKTSNANGGMKMDIKKKLADLEADRTTKAAAMQQILGAAESEGRGLTDEEKVEYKGLSDEVASIAEDEERYKGLSLALGTAKPVVAKGAPAHVAGQSRNPQVIVKDKELPKGIRLARLVQCMSLAKSMHVSAIEVAKARYHDDYLLHNVMKTAIAAGSTSVAAWAGNLVGDTSSVYADFAEYLRPQTIIGRFGANGIPALRSVPFRTRLLGSNTATGAGWVGEGAGIPLTKGGYTSTTLEPNKVATIAALHREVIESSSPNAEALIRDELVAACVYEMDKAFITRGNPGVTDIRPAAINYNITPNQTTGTTSAAAKKDLAGTIEDFLTAKNPLTSGVWIMSSKVANNLGAMENSLGQPSFPGLNMNGGVLMGLPVITSEVVTDTADSGGQVITLVNAADIYYASEGNLMVDVSREASLEMSDAPANSAATPTAAQMTSLFQTDAVAIRVINEVNWKRRRDTGVAVLTDVAYVAGT